MLKPTTLAKFPDITASDILEAKYKIQKDYPSPFTVLKCSPEAYIAIRDYFVEEEHQEKLRLAEVEHRNKLKKIKTPYIKPKNYWGSIFGIDIVLDPELEPGEWRFEY